MAPLPRKTPCAAQVALQHCPILHMSKRKSMIPTGFYTVNWLNLLRKAGSNPSGQVAQNTSVLRLRRIGISITIAFRTFGHGHCINPPLNKLIWIIIMGLQVVDLAFRALQSGALENLFEQTAKIQLSLDKKQSTILSGLFWIRCIEVGRSVCVSVRPFFINPFQERWSGLLYFSSIFKINDGSPYDHRNVF